METVVAFGIVLLAAGWLVWRAIGSYRKTLRGDARCAGECGCGSDSKGSPLVSPAALVRPRKPGPPGRAALAQSAPRAVRRDADESESVNQ